MLRANVNDIIRNSPYSQPVGEFLFGFSSTFIGFGSLFVLLLVLYDYYRFNNNSIIIRSYKFLLNEHEFVLPLYIKNPYKYEEGKKSDSTNVEITEKPDLSSFVIPALNVEQIGLPMSPLSSTGLKRRTISMNSFTGATGTATATSLTPTRIITPFKYEVKENPHSV